MLRGLNKNLVKNLTNQRKYASVRSSLPTVIGIDLGTTNSAVAVMEGKEARILENDEGQRTTPSIVAFDKHGDMLVGNAAKRQAVLNTENTFYATKRLIGRRFDDDETRFDLNHFPYKIVENDNGDAWVESFGKKYSPSQIGGFILKKMKETAESQLAQNVKNAVVTVPAYFNDSQRQATKDAGQIAGLNVLRVVNEPTAAALAYGLDKTNDGLVAVYDLGGGTFDISILDIEDGVFEVRATNGDTHLGGEDFDILLVQFILSDFKHKTGIDLSSEPDKVQRIREAAERAKIDLSHVKETTIDLPFIKDTHHISISLTEDELDQMSFHLISKTIDPVKKALKDADLSKKEIDEIILVGGMTRMPKIRKTVEEIFGKKPSTAVNPDEAVALGAAIQGGVLSGAIKDVLLLDVTPLTLGVDNQTGVEIRVFQGERGLVQDNKLIGNFKLSGIPPLPKGVPQVEVSFDIDADGIINVSAREKTSGKETSITVIGNSGLTEEEIQKMIQEGEQNKDTDKAKRQKVEAATNAELVVNDTEMAMGLAFGDVLKADPDYPELENKIKDAKNAIQSARNGGDVEVADIKNISKELQELSIKIFQRVARKQNEAKQQ
ncbi:unnamed protein product [Wickerhamomyces anomalus]